MQAEFGAHVETGELELYSMGRIEGAQLERIEEHLLVCAWCQDRLAAEDKYVRATRVAAARVAAEPQQPRSRAQDRLRAFVWSYEPILLTVVIAIVLVGVFWFVRPSHEALNPAVVTVILDVARSERGGATVPAGSEPMLHIDLTDLPQLPAYVVEIVNSRGESVWQSAATPSGGKLGLKVEKSLDGGSYWIRLYSSTPERALLREYGLKAK